MDPGAPRTLAPKSPHPVKLVPKPRSLRCFGKKKSSSTGVDSGFFFPRALISRLWNKLYPVVGWFGAGEEWVGSSTLSLRFCGRFASAFFGWAHRLCRFAFAVALLPLFLIRWFVGILGGPFLFGGRRKYRRFDPWPAGWLLGPGCDWRLLRLGSGRFLGGLRPCPLG